MKIPLLIVLTAVVVGVGSTLAIMKQLVQEQPSRMVRSSFRHPAPRNDWAQLGVSLGVELAHIATKGARRMAANFAKLPELMRRREEKPCHV